MHFSSEGKAVETGHPHSINSTKAEDTDLSIRIQVLRLMTNQYLIYTIRKILSTQKLPSHNRQLTCTLLERGSTVCQPEVRCQSCVERRGCRAQGWLSKTSVGERTPGKNFPQLNKVLAVCRTGKPPKNIETLIVRKEQH